MGRRTLLCMGNRFRRLVKDDDRHIHHNILASLNNFRIVLLAIGLPNVAAFAGSSKKRLDVLGRSLPPDIAFGQPGICIVRASVAFSAIA